VQLIANPGPGGIGWGALIPDGHFALASDANNSVFLLGGRNGRAAPIDA
jgi:hypothetical protein